MDSPAAGPEPPAKESHMIPFVPAARTVLCTMAFLATCLALLAAARGQSPQARPTRALRAGAATANITPPLGQPIIGGW